MIETSYRNFVLFIILIHFIVFLQASFTVRKSLPKSVELIISQMLETATAVDEPDAKLVTEFAYNETNSEVLEVL